MANFVPGDASPIADIQPWTPDWSFLEQVYGVTQARYDKGFNMVKNLYNSVLNSSVTNSQNQEFRNTVFQKLQGSLRNVSALDLSNPTNVARAQKLLDPITEDQELAYDMYVTKFHSKQKGIMDNYKNSTDIKLRSLYSDYSKMDIQYAEDDLRKASRGNGSITSVQPREFTPFEDVTDYLDKNAKDAGLVIKSVDSKGGYILTYTNGEQAEKPFSEWAANQIGNKFDRQFQVMGRVKAEGEIRGIMQEKGVSRDQAQAEVAQSVAISYKNDQTRNLKHVNENLSDINRDLALYDRKYPNGVPDDKRNLKASYDKLLEAKASLTNTQTQLTGEIDKLENDSENYVGPNLSGIYTSQAKRNAATNWGVAKADATSEVDMKPDQKVISDWDRAAANSRSAADRALRYKMHTEDQALKDKQFQEKQQLEVMKAKGEGKLPSETYVGTYVGSASTGAQVLTDANVKNKTELFNNTFGANTGLMNLVVDKASDHAKYYKVIQKLNSIARGSNEKFNNSEKAILSQYAKKVGYYASVPDINYAGGASAFLSSLTGNTYSTALKSLGTLSKINNKETQTYIKAFQGTMSAMKRDMQEQTEIDKSYKNIASHIYDYNSKTVRPEYVGAKVIGRMGDNTPIFDLSGLPEGRRQQLETLIGPEFTKRKNSVGGIYTFTKPSSDEIYSLFNTSNTIKITSSDGERINSSILKNLPDAQIKKLIGDQLQASFDPSGEKMIVKIKANTSDAIAKQLKLKPGTFLNVEIPYDMINSSSALTRFKKYADNNAVDVDSYGVMEAFSRNKFATIEAPQYMAATGFDFTATGAQDASGRYGASLTYTMMNPNTKKKEQTSKFIPMDANDPSSYFDLSEQINNVWTNYQTFTGNWEDQFSK